MRRSLIVVGAHVAGARDGSKSDLVAFRYDYGSLQFHCHAPFAPDEVISGEVWEYSMDHDVIVGTDLPLPRDEGLAAEIRKAVRTEAQAAEADPHLLEVLEPAASARPGLVRRGADLARALERGGHQGIQLLEVHPAAALIVRGAAPADLRSIRNDAQARMRLREWLATRGVPALTSSATEAPPRPSAHHIAACACVLAVVDWLNGRAHVSIGKEAGRRGQAWPFIC